jgi:glycolate oxidase FAD binding subunit
VANVQETACTIDGFGPLPVVRPDSVADLGDVVRRAAAEGQAVYPLSGQTMLGLGLPPTRPGIAVDLRGLNKVIDYPARDMTVTVQAGITMAKLQELLATENQWLPIDVPQVERATLGGVLATNISGPRRYGYGTLRDYVLGISVVNDEGHEVKAGGRVVKNVAGYDLMKLYIGSLGTLGTITQVTLKLKPRPECQGFVWIGCEGDALEALLVLVQRSRTRPVCLTVLNAAAAKPINARLGYPLPPAPWVLIAGIEGSREVVDWQKQQLRQELTPDNPRKMNGSSGASVDWLWQGLVEFPAHSGARLTFKANLLPSATAAFCQRATALSDTLLLQAHAGNGIVIGRVHGDLTLDRAQTMLMELQEAAAAGQGNLILPRCPPEWKKDLPVWGRPRGDGWLMRAVKDQLDPKRLFNPGRFVEGI